MIPIRDDNPTSSPPIVTVSLIVANAAVFILQFMQPPELQVQAVYQWGVIPARLLSGGFSDWVTIFSSMFMHGGIAHLGGNMLYLWIFGNNIEDRLGHIKSLIFYLLCGVAAALGQVMVSPSSTVPMVGASGAISGILGAYIVLFPRANVMVMIIFFFIRFVAVPAWVVLGIWFVMQLTGILGTPAAGGGVAFMAHIGGFVFGALTIYLFRPKRALVRRGWPA